MRILIAGGAGFLGSHVAARLLEQGHQVTIIDNLITGRAAHLHALEVRHPAGQLEIRIEDACWMSNIDGRLDAVLHLATPASLVDYLRHPDETLEACATATRRLLELAAAKGARFLLASRSEVHGEPIAHRRHDAHGSSDSDPVGPRSVHDEARRHAEGLAAAFARHGGTRVRIARILDTYGPGMRIDDGRIIPTFISQALRGEPLTVRGSGRQVRSYCYVDDLVTGLLALLWSEVDGPVNLGASDEHSVLEMAYLVIRRTGSSSVLRHLRFPVGDEPRVLPPSIERARRLLDWDPVTRLEDGLEHTIRDLAARLGSRESARGARAPVFARL